MWTGGAVASAALLAACGSPGAADVEPFPHPVGAAAAQCSRLVRALPDRVDGQDRREVSPAGASSVAAAWGDPAIVLRCGVEKPAALRRTSFCFEVNRVGWLAAQDGKALAMSHPVDGTVDFTTIGRSVYVELSVPGAYAPQGDALPAVAAAVRSATRNVRPCS